MPANQGSSTIWRNLERCPAVDFVGAPPPVRADKDRHFVSVKASSASPRLGLQTQLSEANPGHQSQKAHPSLPPRGTGFKDPKGQARPGKHRLRPRFLCRLLSRDRLGNFS